MSKAREPDVAQLMNDYVAARHGDESKLDVLAESFTFSHPFGQVQGQDELIAMQQENERAMPDGTFEVEDMLVGDDVAMWEWTMTGTHLGEWQGIPPTGHAVAVEGMSKTVIADGKVQENRAYFGSQDLLTQLGAGEQHDADAKKEVVRRYNEDLLGDNLREIADEILTEDYVRHAPGGSRSREEFLASGEEALEAYPDFSVRVNRMIRGRFRVWPLDVHGDKRGATR